MGIVKYLLDTHTILWALREEGELSHKAKAVIENLNSPLFVSPVNAYEIVYKHAIGKLDGFSDIAEVYFDAIKELGVTELPITSRHTHFAGSINWVNRDPFDRILAAQAHVEDMILITRDTKFDELDWLETLW